MPPAAGGAGASFAVKARIAEILAGAAFLRAAEHQHQGAKATIDADGYRRVTPKTGLKFLSLTCGLQRAVCNAISTDGEVTKRLHFQLSARWNLSPIGLAIRKFFAGCRRAQPSGTRPDAQWPVRKESNGRLR